MAQASPRASGSDVKHEAPTLKAALLSLCDSVDKILPEHLVSSRADQQHFNKHIADISKALPREREQWQNGLQYVEGVLTMHHRWCLQNHRFVKLRSDRNDLQQHLGAIRKSTSNALSTLKAELLRQEAEISGRLGTLTMISHLQKLASDLSKPPVLLEVNVDPPSETDEVTVSMYCNEFVLDVVFEGGDGNVQSANLTHVVKGGSTKTNADADADLSAALKAAQQGQIRPLASKLERLIARAVITANYPKADIQNMEERVGAILEHTVGELDGWSSGYGADGWFARYTDSAYIPPRVTIQQPPSSVASEDRGASAFLSSQPFEVTFGVGDRREEVVFLLHLSHPLNVHIQTAAKIAEILSGNTEPTGRATFATDPYLQALLKTNSQKKPQAFSTPEASPAPAGPANFLSPSKEWVSVMSAASSNSDVVSRQRFRLPLTQIPLIELHTIPWEENKMTNSGVNELLALLQQQFVLNELLFSCFARPAGSYGRRIAKKDALTKPIPIAVSTSFPASLSLRLQGLHPHKVLALAFSVKSQSEGGLSVEMRWDMPLAAAGQALSAQQDGTGGEEIPLPCAPDYANKVLQTCHSLPLCIHYILRSKLGSLTTAAPGQPGPANIINRYSIANSAEELYNGTAGQKRSASQAGI